jgi:ankyrin repeat protein
LTSSNLCSFIEELIVSTHADVIAAVQAGDAGKIRSLLQDDPSLAAAKDANGVSALMFAFYYRRSEIADLLLAAKSELDIFEATAAGKAEKVSEILKKDPESAKRWSADGFTALHLAAFFGRPDIARILIRNAADVSATSKNPMKVAPLHSAAAAHNREIVRLLLENDAPADVRQEGGWTPLHEAAQNGDVEMTRDLLQHRADPQARSDDGKTPAEMAATKGHEEIVKLLSK